MGIFLAVAGLALMLGHPTTLAPRSLWLIGVLLVALTGSAFLSQASLGTPGVRNAILSPPGLNLPQSITLDPPATLSWVLLLGLSLMIAQFMFAAPPSSSRGMERLALLAVLGCSLYGAMAWYAARTGWSFPFFDKETWTQAFFGFFPNRNHTAGFLLTGAILSLGLILRGITGGRLLPGVIAAFSFAFLTSLLLFNSSSRGGLIFLIAGVVIWIAGLGKQRSRLLIAVTLFMSALIMLLFLASGSGLLERLSGRDPSGASVASASGHEVRHDPRILIWEDTFPMVGDYPLTGTGLGTYGLVYPFYAVKSLRDQSTALHPESDWLQLCSEAGLPALALALLGLALLLRKIPALAESSGHAWPVRWAFLAAFLAELLHGLVDVPLHKPELGWWVMILGGIGFSGCGGLNKERPPGKIPMALQRVVFAGGGIAMLVIGAFLILAQWGGGVHAPPFAPAAARERLVKLFAGGGDPAAASAAIAEARKMIREYPIAHTLRYQLAVMLMFTEHKEKGAEGAEGVEEAKALFLQQQALSPIDPDLPFEQGRALAPREPMTAATFWSEALRRQLELDASPNSAVKRAGDLYYRMIAAAVDNWPLFDRLPALAYDNELRMIWLTQPRCGVPQLAEAARDTAFMTTLSPRDQGRIIELWWRRGSPQDRRDVEAFLASHPEYEESAVMTRAAMLAATGRQQEACALLIKARGIPVSLPKEGDAPAVIRPAGDDLPADPLEAARYYLDHGNDVAARRSLDEALRRESSAEALLLRASIAMRAREWDAALRDLSSWVGVQGK
jgi:O-antigen ligase